MIFPNEPELYCIECGFLNFYRINHWFCSTACQRKHNSTRQCSICGSSSVLLTHGKKRDDMCGICLSTGIIGKCKTHLERCFNYGKDGFTISPDDLLKAEIEAFKMQIAPEVLKQLDTLFETLIKQNFTEVQIENVLSQMKVYGETGLKYAEYIKYKFKEKENNL